MGQQRLPLGLMSGVMIKGLPLGLGSGLSTGRAIGPRAMLRRMLYVSDLGIELGDGG